jgi:hypothetical protein
MPACLSSRAYRELLTERGCDALHAQRVGRIIPRTARRAYVGSPLMTLHFVLLHGSLGLLDDAFFAIAILLAALALLCFVLTIVQERKQQHAVAGVDSDGATRGSPQT